MSLSQITKCLWCQVPICPSGDLWARLDASYEGPLLECSESILFPPVHLPVGRDGWFPSPRYRGVRWG